MADKHEKPSPEQIVEICESYFSQTVEKITAPGGKARESVRVHFADHTIIATGRAYPGRMRLEIEVLERLNRLGAPVPRLIGQSGQMFFQEDVGSERLSLRLAGRDDDGAVMDVAARAFGSLIEIQAAGMKSGLNRIVPPLGEEAPWVIGLISTPVATSQKYGIAPPDLDFQPLTDRLLAPATQFVKWDSRPGNAAIGNDRRVYWFDWEHCGRRQGMEDFAWLAGDEFFPLGADEVVAILGDLLPRGQAGQALDYLTHFIVFHIIQRLTILHRRFTEVGWVDPMNALRYDKIGVDPGLARSLCRHGAGWADRAPLTRPLVGWFGEVSKAIDAMGGNVV